MQGRGEATPPLLFKGQLYLLYLSIITLQGFLVFPLQIECTHQDISDFSLVFYSITTSS